MTSPVDENLHSGLRWSVIRQAITASVGSVGALAYTRYLQPEDLGAFTLAIIVYSGLLLLVQVPFRDAVIYYQDSNEDYASAAFWLLLGFAIISIGLVVSLAGQFGQFYESPLAVPLTRVITIAFLFQAISVVPAAIMLKEFRFALHESLGTIAFFILLAGWLILAPRGYGAWTLVYPQIAAAFFYAAATWGFSRFRPRWNIGKQPYLDILRYSRALLGSKFTIYLQRNLDNAAVGRFGAQALGWYTFGEDQSAAFVLGVGQTIAQITLPALAAVKENLSEVSRILKDMFRLAATASLPGNVGAYLLADIGVGILFGEQWLGGVPIIRAYLIFRTAETFAVICDSATSAIGKPRIRFQIDLLQLPFFVAGVIVGLRLGEGVVVMAWILSAIRLTAMLLYISWTLKAIKMKVSDFSRQLIPSLLAAVIMGIAVNWLRGQLVWSLSLGDDLLKLAITIVFGIIVYVPALFVLDPAGFRATYRLLLDILLPEQWHFWLKNRAP